MSKRSLFWSTASGKIGDIVLRSVHGETIASKYQPQVANPKTYAQMYTRTKFATAVKFYRHATDNFFKFAFEDKKRNESDYNAFMRYNAKRGCVIDESYSKIYPYPAWGESWQLSNGSLPEIPISIVNNIISFPLPSIGEPTEGLTVREFSRAMIKDYGLIEGDYVTVVRIRTYYSAYEYFEDKLQPKWNVTQVKLNTTSDEGMSDFIDMNISNGDTVNISLNEDTKDTSASAAAVIVSRVTKTNTYVSPSYTKGNTMWNEIVGHWNAEPSIYGNLISWGAKPNAILKGAIADKIINDL